MFVLPDQSVRCHRKLRIYFSFVADQSSFDFNQQYEYNQCVAKIVEDNKSPEGKSRKEIADNFWWSHVITRKFTDSVKAKKKKTNEWQFPNTEISNVVNLVLEY